MTRPRAAPAGPLALLSLCPTGTCLLTCPLTCQFCSVSCRGCGVVMVLFPAGCWLWFCRYWQYLHRVRRHKADARQCSGHEQLLRQLR